MSTTDTRTTAEKIQEILAVWDGANGKSVLYARAQDAGHSLEEMQDHKSSHGYFYNEETEEEGELLLDGICAIELGSSEHGFGGSCSDEIVIFKGRHIENVYDGEVVYPTEIVARLDRDAEYNLLRLQI